jgi:hypothetical protein
MANIPQQAKIYYYAQRDSLEDSTALIKFCDERKLIVIANRLENCAQLI